MPKNSTPQRLKDFGRDLIGRTNGTVLSELLGGLRRTRLLDMAYTLSAQAFVAVVPLVLVVTGAFSSGTSQAIVAQQLIQRFGLVGAASSAVQVLFRAPGVGSGIYWLGLLITLYSAFSLSRRVARTYATIWDVQALPPGQQWRPLVWLIVQIVMIAFASSLRVFGKQHGLGPQIAVTVIVFVVWAAAEVVLQQLLTNGQVARRRLVVAAILVSVAHLGVGLWSALYLPGSLAHQATQYGPIGVVFGLFTWIFATIAAQLAAILIAAVLTNPARYGLRHPAIIETGTT